MNFVVAYFDVSFTNFHQTYTHVVVWLPSPSCFNIIWIYHTCDRAAQINLIPQPRFEDIVEFSIGMLKSLVFEYNDGLQCHINDVIMGAIASQITRPTIVYWTIYSDADQREHQSSASLAFVRGIHRGPVNSPYKWPVTRKMFPFYNVIILWPTKTNFRSYYGNSKCHPGDCWKSNMHCLDRGGNHAYQAQNCPETENTVWILLEIAYSKLASMSQNTVYTAVVAQRSHSSTGTFVLMFSGLSKGS